MTWGLLHSLSKATVSLSEGGVWQNSCVRIVPVILNFTGTQHQSHFKVPLRYLIIFYIFQEVLWFTVSVLFLFKRNYGTTIVFLGGKRYCVITNKMLLLKVFPPLILFYSWYFFFLSPKMMLYKKASWNKR